jgi:hypothetical protein
MIIQRRPGIIEENGEKHYIEFSTKTRYDEQRKQQPYIEVLYLDEEPTTTKEIDGTIVLDGKKFILPGGIVVENIEGTSVNYPSKNHIYVTKQIVATEGVATQDSEEKYYGSTLLSVGQYLARVICGGKTVIAGIYEGVTEENVIKYNLAINERKKGSIEEKGETHIKLKKPNVKIVAKHHKEWCGCNNNQLETKVDEINIIRN